MIELTEDELKNLIKFAFESGTKRISYYDIQIDVKKDSDGIQIWVYRERDPNNYIFGQWISHPQVIE